MGTNKKSGISLIVLVITIIVMIILATAIILSLSNSGIINKAKEAKIKSDMKNIQEELNIKIAEMELNGEDTVKLNNQDVSQVIKNAKNYEGKFKIRYGKLYILKTAPEEEIKCAKEIGIEVDDQYIYDNLKFDFATASDGFAPAQKNANIKGTLTVTVPENTNYEYFYKINKDDEFTALTNDFSITEWGYNLDYLTGIETESKIYLGYREKGKSNISSREFTYKQLVAPNASVSIDEATNDIKVNFGDIPIDDYGYLWVSLAQTGAHPWNDNDYDYLYNYSVSISDVKSKINSNNEFLAANFLSVLVKRDNFDVDLDGYAYSGVRVFLSKDSNIDDNYFSGVRPIDSFMIEAQKSSEPITITRLPKKALYKITYVDSKNRIKILKQDVGQRRMYNPEYICFENIGGGSITQSIIGGDWNEWQFTDKTKVSDYFEGWYYDSEFKNKAVMGEPLTKDVTVYAKWKK